MQGTDHLVQHGTALLMLHYLPIEVHRNKCHGVYDTADHSKNILHSLTQTHTRTQKTTPHYKTSVSSTETSTYTYLWKL